MVTQLIMDQESKNVGFRCDRNIGQKYIFGVIGHMIS